jgi:hypothetical protein
MTQACQALIDFASPGRIIDVSCKRLAALIDGYKDQVAVIGPSDA